MSFLGARTRLVGVSLLAACLMVGCSSSSSTSAPSKTTTTVAIPTPIVTTNIGERSKDFDIMSPVGVTVEKGTLDSVALSLADAESQATQPGPGLMNTTKTGWMSPAGFVPHTNYQMVAQVRDTAGKTSKKSWEFTTGGPTAELHTTTNVIDDSTYGVGMPIVVTLSHAVDDAHRAEVTKRMTVTSTPAVTGAWRWVTDTEVRYRPEVYWPAHTKVALKVDFANLDIGGGVWGVDGRTVNFSIGDAHISRVDATTHRMVVTENGQIVRDMAVSTGKDKYPTKSGIHVVNEKAETVTMDSATVGIPKGSPDYYLETVKWNVRISNSGEFVHSAPWSVGEQGVANVSHGCVNAAPADAEWFFNFSHTGDVVEVVGTAEVLQSWNGYGDWQIPWAEWAN